MSERKRHIPDHIRAQHFAAAGRKIESEREKAASTVEALLRLTPRSRWSQLSEHPDLQTCGALEYIGNVVAEAFNRDPLYAKDLAELAVSLAEGLRPNEYPELVVIQVRVHAWKDFGKTLRFLVRYPEAIEAFERADRELEDIGSLTHDRAIVRFNLAVVFQEVGRINESMTLLGECKVIFREHGDTKRLVLCGLAEGVLFQRLRRYREARESYLLLLASTEGIDKESLAALHHAIGFCCVDLGDLAEAEVNLLRAIALHRELGQPIQVLKGELGRGRLLIRSGEVERAILHLRPVRREFLRNGMAEEAGLCGLEIVEAMLIGGRTSEAERLSRKIVSEFVSAGLNTRAITALGYLTEAIVTGDVPPTLVTDVREYILSLQTMPEREFVVDR